MVLIQKCEQYFSRRQTAILLMVIAVISFPLMDTMAKQLSETLPSLQVVWARYTGQFVLILLMFLPRLGQVVQTTQPLLQTARSVALFGGTFFFFTALKYLEIGKVAAIFQIAPVLITILAVLFLGERIGVRRIVSLIAGFAGALIIIQPQQHLAATEIWEQDLSVFAAFLPICAASCYACYSVMTRLVKPGESSDTTLFYTAAFGTIVSSLMMPFIWQTPQSGMEIILMMSMSLCGGLGHYCVIQALMRAEASELAPLNYLAMVFAMMFGYMFFAETPSAETLGGAVLIVLSGLYLWRRNQTAGS